MAPSELGPGREGQRLRRRAPRVAAVMAHPDETKEPRPLIAMWSIGLAVVLVALLVWMFLRM